MRDDAGAGWNIVPAWHGSALGAELSNNPQIGILLVGWYPVSFLRCCFEIESGHSNSYGERAMRADAHRPIRFRATPA